MVRQALDRAVGYTPAPMKYLITILLLLPLYSCELMESFGDPLEDVRMSRHDAAAAEKAIAAANATTDLDGDTDINGWEEWYSWIRTLVQTAKAEAAKEETAEKK